MKIEAGEYYWTRDHRKALVLGVNPFTTDPCGYWVGVVDDYGTTEWCRDGRFISENTNFDLVAPWVEPIVFERVLFLKLDSCRRPWLSAVRDANCIGSAIVKVTEGEFHDDKNK